MDGLKLSLLYEMYWRDEQLQITTGDYGIKICDWISPCIPKEAVRSEQSLPFERIQELFRRDIGYVADYDATYGERSLKIKVDEIQLGYKRVPVKDHAVNAYGGFLSLSSTRSGSKGYDAALAEIYRTLAPQGRLYVIESEWVDVPAILKVFERSCLQPWNCFLEPQLTWHDRFLQSGFRILSEELYMNRSLNSEDNELGREAEKAGIRIGMQWDAYILEKPLSAR